MPKPFAVRIMRLADETTQDMPYKTFMYIKDDIDDVTRQQKFELVGEIDASGNLVPGSPNLLPQHQTKVEVKSAEAVASAGEPKTEVKEAPVVQQEAPKPTATPTPTGKKKMGRPAKVTIQETQA